MRVQHESIQSGEVVQGDVQKELIHLALEHWKIPVDFIGEKGICVACKQPRPVPGYRLQGHFQ